ncbi:hypothetical protein J8I29_08575 [Labrys sp. LIt4]|uniref:hypothetical protein n=1 Tax=Labrys sp. LIt4 TaxID=2821355 RepID=UPI001AE0309D|nr:hypothetical protein [Labrys sp. LIt4]MBP0579357.1 hypothetical protein [Labrys sp. LIt4]
MKIFTISTIAAFGIVVATTAANAHGHLVTGPELYGAPATTQQMGENDHQAGKNDSAVQPRKVNAVRHGAHRLRNSEAY